MKKIILLFLLYAVLVITVLGQSRGIGYQAILRNTDGDPMSNEKVTVLISLLPSAEEGVNPVYTEFHIAETNDFGLVNLEIGRGVAQDQPFNEVDWSGGSMFIEVSIDEDDGNNFQVVGTRELLAVPYALYAANADQSVQTVSRSGDLITLSNGGGSFTDQVDDADADANNEIQDLQLDGNLLSITGNENATTIDLSSYAGGGSTLTEEAVDAFVANNGYLTSETDDQALTLANNTLTLEDGGSVDLSAYLDDTDTQLTETQVDDFVANNGYLTSETDDQALTLADNILTLEDGGTVDLSAYLDDTDTQLTETQVDGFVANNGYLTSETDDQALTLADNTLTLENGGTVDLSAYLDNTDTQLTEAQVDAYANNNGYLSTEVDGDVTNEIQDLNLTGNTLKVTNNSSASDIDLSPYLDNTDTQLTEAQVDAFANNNGYLSTEIDGDATNEIQDLSLTGDNLTITNNASATNIDLSAYKDNTDAQTLTLTGSDLAVSGGNSVDLSPLTANSVLLTGSQSIAGEKTFGETLKTNTISTIDFVELSIEETGALVSDITGQDLALRYMDDPDSDITWKHPAAGDVITFNGKTFSVVTVNRGGIFVTSMDGSIVEDSDHGTKVFSKISNNGNLYLKGRVHLQSNESTITLPNTDGTSGQVLTTNGSGTLTFQDVTFSEVDGSITNEIQDLNLTGDNLKVTNNTAATTIDLSAYKDNTDAQTLSLSGTQLSISGGNNVNLPEELPASIGTAGQILAVNSAANGVEWSTKNDPEFTKTGDVISGGNTTDDFVFGSTALDNDNSTTNDDNRMFFDKSKGAFRAGNANGASWDEANRGDFSMAIGSLATASGDYSSAIGSRISAIGDYATAIGRGPSASSFAEIAIGGFNTFYTPNSTSSWDDADRLLILGNGSDPRGPSDALIVYKSGDATLYGELTIDADNLGGSQGYTFPGQDGNPGQVMTTDGSGNVTFQNLTVSEVDGSITNEIQDLNLTGDNLKVTNNTSATTIDLSPYKDNTDGQTLTLSGSQLSISGGNNVDLPVELPATLGTTGQVLSVNSAADGVEWTTASGGGSGVFTQSGSIISAGGSTDDLVFGSETLDNAASTDDDNRLFYDKSKGSFRTGGVTGAQWNDASVGNYSAAFGQNTTASGSYSTALGFGAIAQGQYALASGSNSTATAHTSSAFGLETNASGTSSAAFGRNTSASGLASFASGIETNAPSESEFALGNYNTTYTPANNQTDRAFVIGNGSIGSRSNALAVYKDGSIEIDDQSTAPTTTTNRLYSVNGALHYNGNEVGGGGGGAAATNFVTSSSNTLTVPENEPDYFVVFNNSVSSATITVPTSPSAGDKISFARLGSPGAVPNLSLTFNEGASILGSTVDCCGYHPFASSSGGTVTLVYTGSTWMVTQGSVSIPPSF